MNDLAAIDLADRTDVTELAADIVSAYVAHNAISSTDLPRLIGEVHAALHALQSRPDEVPVVELTPAVPIKKSITPDYLICLDDGMKFKSLKRHLKQLGMTPEQYREKWRLPANYPMVAPNYSATRSKLALTIGLGRKPSAPEPLSNTAEPAPAQPETAAAEPAKAKPRRRAKQAAA